MKVKKLKTGLILEFDYEQIKTGGFLPALIAAFPTILSLIQGLGGLGGVAAGAAAIANAVKNEKHQSTEKEETKRQSINGKIAKTGSGIKKKEIELSSDFDIIKLVKDLKIKHFRDVFMKDDLPQKNQYNSTWHSKSRKL